MVKKLVALLLAAAVPAIAAEGHFSASIAARTLGVGLQLEYHFSEKFSVRAKAGFLAEAGALFRSASHLRNYRSVGGTLSNDTAFAVDLETERREIQSEATTTRSIPSCS